VRWASLVASLLTSGLASGHAQAKPTVPPAPREDASATDFWREVIEPHSATVTAIVARARSALDKLDGPDAERAVDRRVRALGDAYGMLRYARKLAPENPEVLGLLGTTADELGKTRQALEALEACVRIQGPERAGGGVTGRLGMIYLRMGRLDDAIRWLRYAQGPIAADTAVAAIHLATALAARGQMPDALDVLSNALPVHTNYFTDPVTLVSFALAVHYDRDEQRGAAFEVLDKMQATLQQELGPLTLRALSAMRFAPPEDHYYYQALLYETLGDYTEARAEWALYAAIDDAPWRRRALEHVKAIDAQRSARPGAASSPRDGRRLGSRNPVPRTTK
jgi:tetratricopeptide (TPR) repeat protein